MGVIKLAGGAKSSSASNNKTRRKTSKSSAKRKPAKKRAPRKSATSQRVPAAEQGSRTASGRLRRNAPEVADHVKKLQDVGARHAEIEEAKDEILNEVFETVKNARDDGVAMAVIEDAIGISRQWLYTMKNFKGRSNKKKSAKKPAAKKRAAKRSAGKRSRVRVS